MESRLVTVVLLLGVLIVVVASAIAIIYSGGPGAAEAVEGEAAAIATPKIEVEYDETLAEKGIELFKQVGCTACHAVKSLGITGGAVGPDLSAVLLGNPGAAGSVIGRFFSENGLADPAADPEKAAELLKQFLINPPDYSPTMKAQVVAYRSQYRDRWQNEIVPAIVEMFKKAAAGG